MKKLIVMFFIILNVISFSQVTTVWTKSVIDGNLPAWFSPTGNSERGFAYNPVNNKLYVVSRNAPFSVRVMNADNGADLDTLKLTGVTGGTYLLNDIETSEDGGIFACNLVIDAAGVFKIYRWLNETSDPVVAYQNDFARDKRMGDNIVVIGKLSDNSIEIWVPDQKNSIVEVLGTNDNGNTFIIKRTITLPAATFGSATSVYPNLSDSTLVTNGAGKNLFLWKWDGTNLGQVPGGIISTGTTTTKLFKFPNTNATFIATFQYVAQANARIVDMDGKSPEYYRNYIVGPNLGTNTNQNGTGDIAFKYNAFDASVTMFVLGTNNGIGAFKITKPFLINGRLHEYYNLVGTKLNNNMGFGPDIDLKKLYYAVDETHLYISGEAKLNKTNNDGIVVFLNVSNLTGTGAAAGTSLGGVTNGGHLFGDPTNPNYKNDFETHFAFAMNIGGNDSVVYFDAAKYSMGNKTGSFLGFCRQDGAGAMGPVSGGIFSENSITFAFDSAYGVRRGFEIKIPLSEIGNPTPAHNIKLFGSVVSSTAYFSNVTVPGNVAGDNLGFNPNFQTIPGGPYSSALYPVPVEFSLFTASVIGSNVELIWSTATETNNRGFEIQKSSDGQVYTTIGFINGKGTAVETNSYRFVETDVENGKYFYRLKQIDFDGTFKYSDIVETDVNYNPATFELSQNFPNPFNPSTVIKFSVPEAGMTSLKVYNTLGQEVATLFSQFTQAGSYSVNFDAHKLVSGMYLYELKSGLNSSIKKMMLVK